MKSASPETAVQLAHELLKSGDTQSALRWLRRAARLATADPTVSLMLASALLSIDADEAVAILHSLVERLPRYRPARIGLIAALSRLTHHNEAAMALAAMLTSLAPPQTDIFRTLADRVCSDAGAPGWIGLDGSGTLYLRLGRARTLDLVELQLDGAGIGQVRAAAKRNCTRQMAPHELRAHSLVACCGGQPLVGSGLSPTFLTRVEGFATLCDNGGIIGWAEVPADEESPPKVFLHRTGATDDRMALTLTSDPKTPENIDGRQISRWHFTVAASSLANVSLAKIVDDRGRNLWGSPLQPHAERLQAAHAVRGLFDATRSSLPDRFRPLPASLLSCVPRRVSALPTKRDSTPCDVIVPVYAGFEDLKACLRSLVTTVPADTRIILVNDGSVEPAVLDLLRQMTADNITVLEHAVSRGFPAAINTGLKYLGPAVDRDVVILNSDTILPPRWLKRLSKVAHSDPAIGSCTPLTNDGTIVSYPLATEQMSPRTGTTLIALNKLCWRANGSSAVDIPTGVGFCMLLKGACLEEVGCFRDDVFAQGYGEENDWCLRAAHLGWRHVAAPGVFVAHIGGRSFGAAKALLIERNSIILERLHPGYHDYIQSSMMMDPLADARRRIDRLVLLQQKAPKTIAIVTHNAGGGVGRYIVERCDALAEEGVRVLTLSPSLPGRCKVEFGDRQSPRLDHLVFAIPDELPQLAALLSDAGVEAIEIHHLLNQDPSITRLPAILDVPCDVVVHDYGLWCPRISLVGRGNRYCGEPLSALECEECIADLGSRYNATVTVDRLRESSAQLLRTARRVIVPSDDVAARIHRQFPAIQPVIEPWERNSVIPIRPSQSRPEDDMHVVLVGAFGLEKGYEVLLACARDAARRNLKLRFTIVGHTIDDERLMQTGRIFITGQFAENEAVSLVQAQKATIGFLSSVCPETWCYALSTLWQAGMPVLAFDLGTQSERITKSKTGWLLPLGFPATKINDALVTRGRETLQIQSTTSPTTGDR